MNKKVSMRNDNGNRKKENDETILHNKRKKKYLNTLPWFKLIKTTAKIRKDTKNCQRDFYNSNL